MLVGLLSKLLTENNIADERVLAALVKRWLRELTDDIEEQTQARLIFKSSLLASVNHISCNLFKSVDQIIDRFCTFQVLNMKYTFYMVCILEYQTVVQSILVSNRILLGGKRIISW